MNDNHRTDTPTRLTIWHRDGEFYPITIYADDTPEQIAEHVALNPGTVKVEDAMTGEVLWEQGR